MRTTAPEPPAAGALESVAAVAPSGSTAEMCSTVGAGGNGGIRVDTFWGRKNRVGAILSRRFLGL